MEDRVIIEWYIEPTSVPYPQELLAPTGSARLPRQMFVERAAPECTRRGSEVGGWIIASTSPPLVVMTSTCQNHIAWVGILKRALKWGEGRLEHHIVPSPSPPRAAQAFHIACTN